MSLNKDNHVVVWEKFEELTNSWYAFPPKDSNSIEVVFSQKNLGINKSTKNCKNINIEKFVELGPLGEIPIRRAIYPPGSAAFSGIQWMWEDSKSWLPYSQINIEFIEHNFVNNGKAIFNLCIAPHLSNYTMDLKQMRQINNLTGYTRNVRRMILVKTYTSYSMKTDIQLLNQNLLPNYSFTNFTNGIILNKVNVTSTPFRFGNNSNVNNSTNVFNFNSGFMNTNQLFGNELSLSDGVINNLRSKKRSISSDNCNSTLIKSNNQMDSMELFNSIPKIHFLSLQYMIKRPKTEITYIQQINIESVNGIGAKDILNPYYQIISNIPQNEDCLICYDSLKTKSTYEENTDLMNDDDDNDNDDDSVLQFKKCKHYYHLHCIFAMYNNGPKTGCLKCPSCKHMYGIIIGNCPNGTMKWWVDQSIKLPSHQSDHTIIIEYNINPPKKKKVPTATRR